ncbi:Translation initiation factor IF-2 [Bienertia sinuspersici]
MINNGLKEVTNRRVNQADLHEFEVDHEEDNFVVNLEQKKCGCYRWSLLGIPCWHALACIQLRRLNFEDFIHPAYHVETYSKAYAPTFRAMPGQNQWEVTLHPRPLPPPHRKMPGRPSKKRRVKEVGEDKDREQVKRDKRQNKRSRCRGLGHYKTNCINLSEPTNAPKPQGGRSKSVPTAAPTSSAATAPLATAATASQASNQAAKKKERKGKSAQTASSAPTPPQPSQVSMPATAPFLGSQTSETQTQASQI